MHTVSMIEKNIVRTHIINTTYLSIMQTDTIETQRSKKKTPMSMLQV